MLGPLLQIMHVDEEHNHKLKTSETAVEVCCVKTVKKTYKMLCKDEVGIIMAYVMYLSTYNIHKF